ncbi:MAG: 3-isopropylmalate dehydratase large subunit [Clostridiales bacterium]|nr:3-isopropylmalate dehydratase large subunit [Clostridiales bacterium]
MKKTIVEKIIANHAGMEEVYPGDIVDVRVDRLMINDSNGPTTFKNFNELGAKEIRNPENILVAIDHRVPPWEAKQADNINFCRTFCREHKMTGFREIGRNGIGHQMMCEGFVRPGEIAVGTDSHSTMYGGMGALGCGINSADAAVIMAEGTMWMMVPESCLVTLKGRPRKGVTAKDIALKLQTLASVDHFIYKAIEITGDYAHEMSVASRLVIANMLCETGAKCGILPPDQIVADYLGEGVCTLASDPGAEYSEYYEIDLDDLEPVLACPHATNNVKTVSEVEGVKINQAFLGSCTNGRIEDFLQAAEVLRGRKVHPEVRLIVVPGSQNVYLEMTRMGLTELFVESGAMVLSSGCASCGGFGPGVIGSNEVCISTTNRNWQGRMGPKSSSVYLGSAYSVAAAAVAGKIESPWKYLAERSKI